MDPPAILAVRDQPGVLPDLRVEGEAGLRGVQRIGEITRTLPGPGEEGDEPEPGLVAQRAEHAPDSREVTVTAATGTAYREMVMRQAS